jgi:SpoVK/Ycf46/Vps4 family AAA+-type ATPase
MQIIEVRESKKRILNEETIFQIIQKIKERQEKKDGVRVCETIEDNKISFIGKFDPLITEKIKIYKYKLFNTTKDFEHFSAIKMPCKRYERYFDDILSEDPCLMSSLIHFYKILYYQNSNVMSYFNITKTILVCGPPGTGKSTLARAVFQRLSVRLSKETFLVELNAAKLFSKFYGDTTANLSKILNGIMQLSKDKVVFVSIDEIETLFINRSVVLEKNEPLEGVRIVNSLLLFLDNLKDLENIFVIFTSNFYSHLDPAFVDRCDAVLMMSLPNEKIIYSILRKIFITMMKKSLMIFENITKYEDPNTNIKSLCTLFKNKSPRAIKKMIFSVMPTCKTTVNYICDQLKCNLN